MKAFLFAQADRFLPDGATDVDEVRRLRAAIFQSWLGLFFTGLFGCLYALLGSPLSGASILLIFAGLVFVPWLVRWRVSIFWIAHSIVGTTWLSTFVVATRSGGFTSPAVVWNFLLPLAMYSVCGKRSAFLWAALGGVQIAFFFFAGVLGFPFAEDFGKNTLAILRISGYSGVIVAAVAVLLVVESARAAGLEAQTQAERALERQRILDDMHDGVGSQLLGLLVQTRSEALSRDELERGLEDCLNDLRLIVDSLDPFAPSLSAALGEVRARIDARSRALGIRNAWQIDDAIVDALAPKELLQLLRALQEMVANAQRHAESERLVICLRSADGQRELAVRDYGKGFSFDECVGKGRGLRSLVLRADRLGGRLSVQVLKPGTRIAIHF